MEYRNDVDGLRALAVVPILLFHAGMLQMSGGFIGVDIFFVISGFLITSIILPKIENSDFSILDFYKRRIIRIFPALFSMLAIVFVWGCLFLLPGELKSLSQSAAAAASFVSNLFFWKTSGYFDSASEAKPLLHTWSLAVEEQFYLFYPFLLMLLVRISGNKIKASLWAMTLASFFISLLASYYVPNSAFYLLPSRAWELGMGAIVAVRAIPRISSSSGRNILSVVGLSLILIALFVIRADDLFPAPWALLPCLGASLLIAYGQATVTDHILSTSPLRWVGAISYSLYLWHWPIITFYRINYGFTLSLPATAGLVLVSIVFASISYYVIEQPALRRFKLAKSGRTVVVGVSGVFIVAALSAGVAINAAAIVQAPADIKNLASFAEYASTSEYKAQSRKGECFTGDGEEFKIDSCFLIDNGRRNILLLGDSHAAQYYSALQRKYNDFNIVQVNVSGCRPLLNPIGEERCTKIIKEIFEKRLPNSTIRDVILAARWHEEEFQPTLDTIGRLVSSGYNVIVIGPTVEYDGVLPNILARSAIQSRAGGSEAIDRYRLRDRQVLDQRLKERVEATGAKYFSAYDAECPHSRCRLFTRSGQPYHFDYGHLTSSAATEIVAHFPSLY